jgi:hypothetical protein
MNEQDKKLIEEIKSGKMPEKEKKHTIAFIRKDRRQKEAFMKLPKEERLKAVYKQHIDTAILFALELGARIQSGDARRSGQLLLKDLRWRSKVGLTAALKEARVLPLGK